MNCPTAHEGMQVLQYFPNEPWSQMAVAVSYLHGIEK